MKRVVVLFVFVCVSAIAACAQHVPSTLTSPPPPSPMQSVGFRFDGNFGGFRVRGAIQRSEVADDKYAYVTQPTLVLNDDKQAPGKSVRLTKAVLTASVIDEAVPSTHRRVLFSTTQEIRVEFRANGEEKTVPELRFVLPRVVERESEYITLSFTDGQRVLQVPLNLKRYWE